MTTKPSKYDIEFVIRILDDWLDRLGACPLHVDNDADADECTCSSEAAIICVRDWLKGE